MPKIKSKYIVIMNMGDIYTSKFANTPRELIMEIADATHVDSDLFVKAMNGMISVDDMVELYNHFSASTIRSICEIKDTVYDDGYMEKGKTIKCF